MKVTDDHLMLIDDFLKKIGQTRAYLYERVRNRDWYNGFVLLKPSKGRKWIYANYKEYLEWVKPKNYRAA